jgi:hypothetical protein
MVFTKKGRKMCQLYLILKADPNFANAFAAVFSAATAFLALCISVITICIQRHHNVISIRPVPEVTVADYENSLRIKLRNNGIGPMIIRQVIVRRGNEFKESVIDWMPALPKNRLWNHFSTKLQNRTLQTDGVIPLLELTEAVGEQGFSIIRDNIRHHLCNLTVDIVYTDMYGTKFKIYKKELTWFGRNINELEPG